MTDEAEKRGQLIFHLEDALALADIRELNRIPVEQLEEYVVGYLLH